MTGRHGTGAELVPVPVDLGQALAFPGIYLEPPAGMTAPRVRRPGRIRRHVAPLVGLAIGAAVLAGCGTPAAPGTPWIGPQAARAVQSAAADLGQVRQHVTARAHRHAPAGCHTPAMPDGSTISVDAQGDATAPYTGGLGFRCDGGTWVRIPAPAAELAPIPAQPQRPVWNGRGFYPNDGIEPLCPAADAGRRAVAGSGADRFTVVCGRDGSEFAWSVAR